MVKGKVGFFVCGFCATVYGERVEEKKKTKSPQSALRNYCAAA